MWIEFGLQRVKIQNIIQQSRKKWNGTFKTLFLTTLHYNNFLLSIQ